MTLYMIGHGNTTLTRFLDFLTRHGIEVLIESRRQPYSRFSTQSNRPSLCPPLGQVGLVYPDRGDRLGGRPSDPHSRLRHGTVDDARLAAPRIGVASREQPPHGQC
jgi:uncharacterized protein (DUF488 family)